MKQAKSEIKEDGNSELSITKISDYLDVGKYNLSEDKIPNPFIDKQVSNLIRLDNLEANPTPRLIIPVNPLSTS